MAIKKGDENKQKKKRGIHAKKQRHFFSREGGEEKYYNQIKVGGEGEEYQDGRG